MQAGTLRVCTGHAAPLLVVPEDGSSSHCRLLGPSLWGEEARPVDVSYPNTDQRCVFGPSNTYEGWRSTSPNYLRRVDPYASKGSAVPDRQLATLTSLFIYKYTRKYVQIQGFVCMRQRELGNDITEASTQAVAVFSPWKLPFEVGADAAIIRRSGLPRSAPDSV